MKKALICFMTLLSGWAFGQQKEIRLYDGPAPGSERWTWQEGGNDKNSVKVMTVYNVVNPTLTVFQPDPAFANGTAIVIAPGGGFHFLAIDHEGTNIASWLAAKGITVFVLKYRLVHVSSDNPFDDMINAEDHKAWDDEALPIIPLAVSDGRKAISYLRQHAKEFKISADKIGIMGFSAGGMVAASTAFNYSAENRPDFVAPIYGDIPESIQTSVKPDAPPLFLACTQDDEFGFATHAVSMYNKWYTAKRPVEMHLFTKGGHGFGIGNANDTTHNWLDRFFEWLVMQGMIKS